MNEESNQVINFTTQNAFLHYGVKGMKWGVITSEYVPVGRRFGRLSLFNKNKMQDDFDAKSKKMQDDFNAFKNESNKNYEDQKNKMNKDYEERTKKNKEEADKWFEEQKKKQEEERRKREEEEKRKQEEALEKARKDEKDESVDINDKETLKSVIDYSNKQKKDDEEDSIGLHDNEFGGRIAQECLSKMDKYGAEVERYKKAFESIEDMDPKYQERLLERHREKINSAIGHYANYALLYYSNMNAPYGNGEQAEKYSTPEKSAEAIARFSDYWAKGEANSLSVKQVKEFFKFMEMEKNGRGPNRH